MFWNQYPYMNLNDLNLDYVLKTLKSLSEQLENFISLNTIKYANPIQWNITKQYEANTVVIDANDGTAYLSVQAVPTGVAITNTDYWTPIFTLNLLSANQNITFRDDGANVLATFASSEGDWLIWNNTLYKVSRAIAVNEAYVVGYNLTRYSVELFVKDYINAIITTIGDLNDLDTTDKDCIIDAINEIVSIVGDLTALTTTDKDCIVDAINEINSRPHPYKTPEQYGAVGDGITDDTQAIRDMVNNANDNTIFIFSSDKSYYLSDSVEINNKNGLIFMNAHFTLDSAMVSPSWIQIKNSHYITFKNCYFKGNTVQIIHLFTCDNIVVENCVFEECGYCIIQETGYISNNVNVNKCRFYNIRGTAVECNCGVGYDSDNWIVTDCIAVNDPDETAANEHCFVTITAVSHVVISNNIAKNFKGAGIVQLERVSESIIVNGNVFENCAGLAYIDVTSQGKQTIITNNKIKHNYSTTNTAFIYLGNQSDNMNVKCIIANNHFVGNGNIRAFRFYLANPASAKNYTPVLVSNNTIEGIEQLFAVNAVTEMVKMIGNTIKATTDCLNYSMNSTETSRLLKNCSFINNRFIGNVILDQNYIGTHPNTLLFDGNEIHGNVDIKRCDNMLFLNNILWSDSTYSFAAGTGSYANGNFQYGVGAI